MLSFIRNLIHSNNHSTVINNVKIIRSSRRKKTITLRFREGLPEVLCPTYTNDSFLKSFLKEKESWIKKKLNEKRDFYDDDLAFNYIPFKGERLIIKIYFDRKKIIRRKANLIQVFTNDNSQNQVKKIIKEWLKNQSYIYLEKRAHLLGAQVGIKFGKFKIKGYKRIWGCCVNQKEIILNWKLIMLPIKVADYVIIHELCHIEKPNHSKEFWELVELKCPEFKQSKKWLQVNGASLIRL